MTAPATEISTEPTNAPDSGTTPTPPVSAGIPAVETPPSAPPASVPGEGSFRAQLDSLPPELRGATALGNVKDFPDLISQFVNAQSAIGRKGIMPIDPDVEGDADRYYEELGRPKTAGDYDLGEFEVPEGTPWDPEFQSRMLERMHARGVPNDMAAGIISDYAKDFQGQITQRDEQMAKQRTESDAYFRQEWGTSYQSNLDLTHRAIREALGSDESINEFANLRLEDGSLVGDNKLLIQAWHHIGSRMKEGGVVGAKQQAQAAQTPQAAQDEFNEMSVNPEMIKILWDEHHPQHDAMVQKRLNLLTAIHGNEVELEV